MKCFLLIIALCCALLAVAPGCGSDDSATSKSSDGSATTTSDSPATDDEGKEKPTEAPASSKIPIGDYEEEGPFSAVSGQEGDEKPRFTPTGQPPPKKIVTRDLEVGSGPAAQPGDEVSVYFAGAIYETGKVELFGWPPSKPSVFELGAGLYGKSWEKAIEGMKVGGVRQVILPSSDFAQGKPVDYVIALMDLQPKSE